MYLYSFIHKLKINQKAKTTIDFDSFLGPKCHLTLKNSRLNSRGDSENDRDPALDEHSQSYQHQNRLEKRKSKYKTCKFKVNYQQK